jgi:DNA-binding CsgD family transcriptional regulator
LSKVAIAVPQVSGRRPPARPRAGRLEPEATFAAVSLPRDPRERLLSRTLNSLAWLTEAALAIACTVDERGSAQTTMVHCTPGHNRRDAAVLVRGLRQLEPIDPFNPRRAETCRASVMSAADAGGLTRYTRSVYGQRLCEYGYGAPIVLYLWRDGRVAAGVMFVREWDARPFDGATVRLVRQLHGLLQHAFGLAGAPQAAALDGGGTAVALTAREAEIARLVAGGASNACIGRSLTISEATVKAHLTRIYVKLGVRSRTQLAVVMGDAG